MRCNQNPLNMIFDSPDHRNEGLRFYSILYQDFRFNIASSADDLLMSAVCLERQILGKACIKDNGKENSRSKAPFVILCLQSIPERALHCYPVRLDGEGW